MNSFLRVPASKRSKNLRRLLFGFGVNDSDYMVTYYIGKKQIMCPFYLKWRSMMQRCYSQASLIKSPSYFDCYVCEEWKYFSAFRAWMEKQDWKDLDLDKDIINPNNKIYNPDNCVFVPKELNNLLTDRSAARGKLPQGVSYHKASGKFCAQISTKGKATHIGLFEKKEEARRVYIKEKIKYILLIANEQLDQRLCNGLKLHADLIYKKYQGELQ